MAIDNVITTSQVVHGTRICTWVTSVLAVIGLIDLCIHCTAVFITLKLCQAGVRKHEFT